MTSLKDFFPLHGVYKPQKNFIKENIQKVKGCNHCNRKKETSTLGVSQYQRNGYNRVPNVMYTINERQPVIKCNVKFVGREKTNIFQSLQNDDPSTLNKDQNNRIKSYRNQECQTDIVCDRSNNVREDINEFKSSCTVCGHVVRRKNAALQVAISSNNDNSKSTDYFSHAVLNTVSFHDKKVPTNSDDKKEHKENIPKGILKPSSNYKIGIVPRYLKERNAKCEQEKKATQEKEELEESLGIKDPDCPSGHMLMPNNERIERLNQFQKEFDDEIRKLNRIPVSSDSYTVRQKKIQIENELNRIEEAMTALRKVKVFIKIEQHA